VKSLALVVIAGVLFALGDVVARAWGKTFHWKWYLAIILVATAAYSVFGYLARDNEFSRAAIWVSISLTLCSCTIGILFYKDPLTYSKVLALVAALFAAYLSVQDW
jgi:multidrug transporter EmrE-like cation transporter